MRFFHLLVIISILLAVVIAKGERKKKSISYEDYNDDYYGLEKYEYPEDSAYRATIFDDTDPSSEHDEEEDFEEDWEEDEDEEEY